MLKRYQVLLEDRLADHCKTISEKYDISFSEAIRILLSLQIPKLAAIAHPKCKVKHLDQEMVKTIKAARHKKLQRVNLHRLISEIYFEGRKSIETWTREENGESKE